jgi:hypothetical protein
VTRPKRIKTNPAKYFPMTISLSRIGMVDMISMVPKLFSLDINPIDTAGMKKRYTRGTIPNNTRMSDSFIRKNWMLKK